MKASIVLPNLNGAGWLKQCLESLYAQTVQDFELIVIDNASTDESLEIARSYRGTPGYTLIENTVNTGFSKAVNQGIRLAKAPFVLLFNNDALARPDMLEQLLLAMETHPKAFGVQCLMRRYHEPELVDDAGDFVTIIGWAFKRGDGLPVEKYTRPQRIFSACGGASMYRREVFDEIGLFDETFFAYLEDVDISWRANNLGYKNYYWPAAQCRHIGSATTSGPKGGQYNNFKSIQSGRNSLLLPYKNMPFLMLLLNLPFVAGGYLLKTLVFHLRGFGKPWRQGMREAFACLGKLDKPRFKLKKLPHYFWAEGSMFISTFRYIAYRVKRQFQKKP